MIYSNFHIIIDTADDELIVAHNVENGRIEALLHDNSQNDVLIEVDILQ